MLRYNSDTPAVEAYVNSAWTSLGGSSGGTGSSGGFVNKLRNGSMLVSQRLASNTSMSLTTTDAYWIDGWLYHITGAAVSGYWQNTAFTATSGNSPAYLPGYMEIKGAASNTGISIYQRIESYDAVPLAGQTATVQFQFYNNSGASITPTFQTCYASAQDNFTTCTADISATNMQACANGTTCMEAYTFTVSANAVDGYQVQFNFGAMTSSSDIIEMSGFDLRATPGISTGINSAPPTIEIPTAAAELARDQRYLVAYGPIAGVTVGTGIYRSDGAGLATTINFPVRMRVAPTVTCAVPGNLSFVSTLGINAGAVSSYVGNTLGGFTSGVFVFQKSGLSSGSTYYLYLSTASTSNLVFSAEL